MPAALLLFSLQKGTAYLCSLSGLELWDESSWPHKTANNRLTTTTVKIADKDGLLNATVSLNVTASEPQPQSAPFRKRRRSNRAVRRNAAPAKTPNAKPAP